MNNEKKLKNTEVRGWRLEVGKEKTRKYGNKGIREYGKQYQTPKSYKRDSEVKK